MPLPPQQSTRERLLDAAEDLFAELGVGATSLRTLTGRAGVNLAAVHYHFGSKQALLDALVERHAVPMNAQRNAELDRFERDGPLGAAGVERLLWAYITPGLRELADRPGRTNALERVLSRIEAQPATEIETLFRRHFGQVTSRFVDALCVALPHLPREQVADRFRFAIGLITQLVAGGFSHDTIPQHPPSGAALLDRVGHAISFLVAGLTAPAVLPATAQPAAADHAHPVESDARARRGSEVAAS